MSGFTDCISKSSLSKRQKKKILSQYDEDVRRFILNGKPQAQAEVDAAKSLFDEVVAGNVAKKGAYVHNMRIMKGHYDAIETLDGMELVEYTQKILDEAYVTGENSFTAALASKLSDAIGKSFNPVTGSYFKSQAMFEELVYGRYGKGVGGSDMSPVIKGMVKDIEDMTKTVNKMLQASGVSIKEDPTWIMPQYHVPGRMIGEANEAAWINMHMKSGFLDWDNMGDFLKGRVLPTTDEGRRELLAEVYNTIVTGGVKDAGGNVTNSIASKYVHRRFIRYKTPEAWLEAHKAWGDDDIFGSLMTYVRRAGRDIALMQNLGANPAAAVRGMNGRIEKRAGELDKSRGKAGKGLQLKAGSAEQIANNMYRVFSFAHKSPDLNPVAKTAYAGVNMLSSARLTATTVAALFTDRATTALVKKRMGAGASSSFVKLMLSKNNKVQAVRNGAGVHSLVRSVTASERFLGEVMGPNWARQFPEFTVRFTGLANITTAGRQAFQVDAFGMLGDLAGTKFNDIPTATKGWFESYGITEADWDVFRATPKLSDESGGMLPVIAILDRTDIPYGEALRLFKKFGMAVDSEMEKAIPTMSLRARVAKGESIDEASTAGVFMRTGGQFMGFSLSMFYLHMLPQLRRPGMGAVKGMSALVGLLTLAGATTLQAKAIIDGRDPEDMTTLNFWLRSALQGGGLGFAGDVLSRGTGMLESPSVRFLDDTGRLGKKAYQQLVEGRDAGLTGEFIKYMSQNTPALDSWQARLITRTAVESAIKHFDSKAFNRMRMKQMRSDRKADRTRFKKFGKMPSRMPKNPFGN